MDEIHLFVIWEKARKDEDRILADMRRHVDILATFVQSWPGDPREGFARFYGAKAQLAAGKVESCGGGAFRTVIVREKRPRYGWMKTSRGTEAVNRRMFAMKLRYRKWVGGGHAIHCTNSIAEAMRDIFLLTGRTPDAWRSDVSVDNLVLVPAGGVDLADPGASIKAAPDPVDDPQGAAELCKTVFPVRDLRPLRLANRIPTAPFKERIFSAVAEGNVPCTVSYLTYGRETLVNDWDFSREVVRAAPDILFRPLFFRMDENGERFGIAVREAHAGRSLRDAVRAGLSAEASAKIAAQLLSLVRTLRELKICHRDLTPDTLVVCDDGTLRLRDFAFAVRLRTGCETRALSRHPEVLAGLGGGYRMDAGRWSDALAARRCLDLLPEFAGKGDVIRHLSDCATLHRIRLRHKFQLLSFARFVRLAARNLVRVVRGKAAKEKPLMTLLAHAFALPVRGEDGFNDLQSVFATLDAQGPYVVLRNYEMLPDDFDPTLHGDIDFLVEDEAKAAQILCARKVVKKPGRVHYEITVAGRPVRLDLRHVGDDYYCEAWERDILSTRRRLPGGFAIPSAENAFHSLVYHARFQKFAIAADYPGKIAACAAEAGVAGKSIDEWTAACVRFLIRRGYAVTRPRDPSVKYNEAAIKESFAVYGDAR